MNAVRLQREFVRTSQASTDLVFLIDEDDPERDMYYYYLTPLGGQAWTVPSGGRRGIVDPLNWGWKELLRRDEVPLGVGFFGDDVVPKTVNWDGILLEELAALYPRGVVYGNDLLQGQRLATHPIVSYSLPEKLGWLALPALQHLCVDVIWHRIGEELGAITYRDDVILEHLHPANGKAKSDDGYKYVNSNTIQTVDGAAMNDYFAARFAVDLELLR